jgi:hypothetical protein
VLDTPPRGDNLKHMETRSRIVVWFLAAFSVVSMSYGAGALISSSPVRHALAADPAQFDLGMLSPLQSAEAKFALRNHAKVPITIRQVVTGCGCAFASIDGGFPLVLGVGETVELRVGIDAAKLNGELFDQRATVVYHLDSPMTTLKSDVWVSGSIDRSNRFRALPGSLHFTVMHGGGGGERSIVVLGSAQSLESLPDVIELTGEVTSVRREYSSGSRAPSRREVRIVHRESDLPVGTWQRILHLILDGPVPLETSIPVTVAVVPTLRAIPARLLIAFSGANSPVECMIEVRHLSKVATVLGVAGDIVPTWRPEQSSKVRGGTSNRVRLTFDPREHNLDVSETVTRIETDLGVLDVPTTLVMASPNPATAASRGDLTE